MARSFTTSFGRNIPLIEGYRGAHKGLTKAFSSEITEEEAAVHVPMTYSAFRKDLTEYVLMMDFLKSIGIQGPWQHAIDVGGREATVARLLRGTGNAGKSESIDVFPFHQRLTTPHFRKLFKEIYAPARGPIRIPRRLAALVNKKYEDWCHPQNREFGFLPHKGFGWDVKISQTPEAEAYHVGDFMTHPLTHQYDFICSLLTVIYFDVDAMFERIAKLLKPNGIFMFFSDYFWFPVNSAEIIGDFPYAYQRLTKEDFLRYIKEFLPEEAVSYASRYDKYHHGKPATLASYAAAAEKHGLSILGEQRYCPSTETSARTPLAPRLLDHYEDSALTDVVEDIHQFRSDVAPIDLRTAFVSMVFEKRPPRQPSLAQAARELPTKGYGLYKSGMPLRGMQHVAERRATGR